MVLVSRTVAELDAIMVGESTLALPFARSKASVAVSKDERIPSPLLNCREGHRPIELKITAGWKCVVRTVWERVQTAISIGDHPGVPGLV